MKLYIRILVALTFILSNTIQSQIAERVITSSIPKSGTYLLANCIEELTKKTSYNCVKTFYTVPNQELVSLTKKHFLITHLKHSPGHQKRLRNHKFKGIFIYRDPRDQLISLTFYTKSKPHKWLEVQHLDFNGLLMEFIRDGFSALGSHGINQFYRAFLPWKKVKDFYTVKFEDLIGPQGGGSQEAQLYAIQGIANHIGIKPSYNELERIAKKIFGNSPTFRKGEVGSWRKYFTQEHIQAFKETAGQLLIDLGYEKDLNW
jgi:sulfotransferase 6B1